MKLISWNVNGLRACIQKGFLDFFNESNADFFCLQETKLQAGQLSLEIPGYEQYWCYAEKKGYSGTAVFTKHKPINVFYGIGVPELDTEGRVIILEYVEFFLVNCYTPNAQRGLARIEHRLQWEKAFRNRLTELDRQKPVILCGDLNVAHQNIDLKNPGANRGNAGLSDEERAAFSQLLSAGFTDSFRHLHPEATGCYTWWSYMFNARQNNAGWRIDYFVVSDRIANAIGATPIHSQVLGSDHCPVELDISLLCNGSVWPSDPQGQARVAESPKPKASVKKGIATALAAVLLLGAGFAAGFFTHKAVSVPQNTPLDPLYIYTESTSELVGKVLSIPELQNMPIYSGRPPLTQKEYEALKALYPVLSELEGRSDAVTELRKVFLASSTFRTSYLASVLLTLEPYANQTTIDYGIAKVQPAGS